MSKEPAEIFERAAEDGFIGQVRYNNTMFTTESSEAEKYQ
jgi:hypothetical protein